MEHGIVYTMGNLIQMGDRGRLVLPAEIRDRLQLKTGDRLVVSVASDGSINLVPARDIARRCRGFLRLEGGPDGSAVDEFLARKREESWLAR